MTKPFIWLSALLIITACSDAVPDRAVKTACYDAGHQDNTPAFEACLKERMAERLMQQQRREYEQRKEYESLWRKRGY